MTSESTPSQRLDDIISRLEGYDPAALPVDSALEIIAHVARPVRGIERVAIRDAHDRVLAHDLLSPIDVPAHDNSAMDGYAVVSADLLPDTDTRLPVAGTVLAGQPRPGRLEPGHALRIMTGAVMPDGADMVVPQELTRAAGDHEVSIAPGQQAGQHLRRRGEDLRAGTPALRAGRRIGPADLGLIASLGVAEVPVRRRPRVAFFSSGDELRSIGEPLGDGQIYDSNRYTIHAMLRRLGCDILDLGVVPDRPEAIEDAVATAAAEADAIISSGGVSVGAADHTRAIMGRLGDVRFWTIAMRPGRPMAFGHVDGALYFGLPGNPVAVMVTFLFFAQPALRRLMGETVAPHPLLRAISRTPFRKRPGRTEYQRGVLGRDESGRMTVAVTGQQGSGVLRSMSEADCIVVLHHDQGPVAVGDPVDCIVFRGLL